MFQTKSTILPLVLLTIAAAVVLTTMMTTSGVNAQDAPRPAAARAGQQWEYRALRIQDRRPASGRERELGARRSGSEATLNQLGAEGWELVAVRDEGNNSDPVFYFKRRK